ncbi:MAG: hypothetical protein J6F30_08245 [Cellulosilyticum sp.]|nr:hypothetical protein [Cellulosilyticum sp.]
MNEVLVRAIEVFGEDIQHDIAVEEMAELTKEIIKWKRNKLNGNELASEIADVEIMLEQLKIMHDNHKQVEIWKKMKLERLVTRIECRKNELPY